MMTFISCAKTMTDHSKVEVPTTGTPQFQAEAIQHALDMSRFSAEELERLLRVSVLKTLQQKIFNTYKIICVSLPFYMDYFVRLT